jgi:hypothetical protein
LPEIAESIALELLTHDGVEVIWQLHLAAAAAHRLGHRAGAETLLKIAEAAEVVWSHGDRSKCGCACLQKNKAVAANASVVIVALGYIYAKS